MSLGVARGVRHPGVVLLAGILGCGGSHDSPPPPPGDQGGQTVTLVAPDSTYELRVPVRWTGVYRIDSLSTQELGTARPGALNLVYLPADSSYRAQTLVVVAVYDSAAWTAVRAEQGPPPGDSVAARGGRVYVVGLPQSNPFPQGSQDAGRFNSLELRPAEVAALVRVR